MNINYMDNKFYDDDEILASLKCEDIDLINEYIEEKRELESAEKIEIFENVIKYNSL
ncbi:MAG: hypothetical protein SOZ89_01950 [Peptoniphilaceae bacterium]|nr:hypothetical protein [Peptoniphilaceae bacterium]MDD7383735.1 hypothetical protein [Peptoniphilaceae bacterium]MDY3737865.1 hypothetical protein [Peptoniphilaceae bacterium]